MKLPYDPSRPSVGWMVGRSVLIGGKGRKLHFHAPIGGLVLLKPTFIFLPLVFISTGPSVPYLLGASVTAAESMAASIGLKGRLWPNYGYILKSKTYIP